MIFSCIRLDFQIFMDPEEEKAVVMEQRPDVRLEYAADASLFGQGDRANRSSMRPQTIWRSEEGFWVDFKSVDLGPPSAAPRESVRNYGSVVAAQVRQDGFLGRNWEHLKVGVLALVVLVCCFFMWRFLVNLSEETVYNIVEPYAPAAQQDNN